MPLPERFRQVRKQTVELCRPLSCEDYVVQPDEYVSPPKWHLAHTTWFFEAFVLTQYLPSYRVRDASYAFLFNSYYESIGPRADKARRGQFSRPTVEEVLQYRADVEEALEEVLGAAGEALPGAVRLIELGIHHEQQHQELLLADIKRILHFNPCRPAYLPQAPPRPAGGEPAWMEFPEGLREVGWSGEGFAFDNERPSHRHFQPRYRVQDRRVDNRRYLAFMEDGGYRRPELWLSVGWAAVQREKWQAPMYWEKNGGWNEFTLHGMRPLDMDGPVCHVSYFEADAFARWSRARLPTEQEWEAAARAAGQGAGAFLEDGAWHPRGGKGMMGDAWDWTASAYLPYPGFKPLPGAVGEYNGKFMVDQIVLRGGSCATPRTHIRPTYRNFFPAATRWQFSGIRLAEDG